MLTALAEEDDRIRGLEVGADDYLTKPFSPRELVLRVKSVLRRTVPVVAAAAVSRPAYSSTGTSSVDTRSRKVELDGRPVALTLREFDLLAYFLENRNRVLSREALLGSGLGLGGGRQLHGDRPCAAVAREGRAASPVADPARHGVGPRLPVGPRAEQSAMTGALLFSMAVTAVVGVLLGVGVMALANRSPRWAAMLAPLVGLVAMITGVAIGTQKMVIADDTRQNLWWIVAATRPSRSAWASPCRCGSADHRTSRSGARGSRQAARPGEHEDRAHLVAVPRPAHAVGRHPGDERGDRGRPRAR
jgi:CheY-like chemotaxis protein